MQITQSSLEFSTAHLSQQERSVRESLQVWVGNPPDQAPRPPESSIVTLSTAGQPAEPLTAAPEDVQDIDKAVKDAVDKDPKLNLLRRMMEALTGEKIRVLDLEEFTANVTASRSTENTGSVSQTARTSGFGVAYDYQETYRESEQTQFAASGTLRTKDGQEINFRIELSMTRTYEEQRNVSIRLGDAARPKDPLVLNFDGNAAQLSDLRFAFDLDSDGSQERVSTLLNGSAYLVFDRNGNQQADDGRELFGPSSGNGFSELSRLDDDQNGWIDAGDQAFKQLALWRPDEQGRGSLQSLSASGIGALSLAAVNTPFSLKNMQNETLGLIRQTGVFLQENGGVGTMQQVDLMV